MSNVIPDAVASAVNDLLKKGRSHVELEHLFRMAGAPGDPPPGLSHANKWKVWLLRANDDPTVDTHLVLGRILKGFMEVDPLDPSDLVERQTDRELLSELLARHGLSYSQGGKIRGREIATPTRSLESILRDRDLPALKVEFERALQNVAKDPPAAVTSACAIVEAMCKVYIEDEDLESPSDQTIKPLWKAVQKDLGL